MSQVGLTLANIIDESDPWSQKARKRRAGATLRRTGTDDAAASPGPSRVQSHFRLSQALTSLLHKHGLKHVADTLRLHEMDEAEILRWDLHQLVALLKAPAASVRRLLEELQASVSGLLDHGTKFWVTPNTYAHSIDSREASAQDVSTPSRSTGAAGAPAEAGMLQPRHTLKLRRDRRFIVACF